MTEARVLYRGAGNAEVVQADLVRRSGDPHEQEIVMERAEALALVRRLAVDVHEPTEEEAVARLLERVANAAPELKAALVELGALAVLREAGGR